ncbi:MAG: hypothetical protein AAF547_06460 [Actinomycetota bacterium]
MSVLLDLARLAVRYRFNRAAIVDHLDAEAEWDRFRAATGQPKIDPPAEWLAMTPDERRAAERFYHHGRQNGPAA